MVSSILLIAMRVAFSGLVQELPDNWRTIRGARADSAWTRESWSIEVCYRSGIDFGDLLTAEQDMADDVGLTVQQYGKTEDAALLLQSISLGLGVWRNIKPTVDGGVLWTHDWVFATAGGQGAGLLLSSDAFVARARWFPLRRLVWEIGPQVGLGFVRGTLSRYPIEQDATPHGENAEFVKYVLGLANADVDAQGIRAEFGGALEVRIVPRLSVGGSIMITRDSWSLIDDNPLLSDFLGYPTDPVSYRVGIETHAAYRF